MSSKQNSVRFRRASSRSARPLPNLLFIGADKCGSTWFHKVLMQHPDIWITPAKDLYYFVSEWYGDEGRYLGHFNATTERWVGEVCHDYLHSEAAARRIHRDLGEDLRLIACLRDPVDRAMSQFIFARRNGVIPPDMEFDQALLEHPLLIENARYGKALDIYSNLFGLDALCVIHFDDLGRDENMVADELWRFLQLPKHKVDFSKLDRNEARDARYDLIAGKVKRAAVVARGMGGARLVGRLKSNAILKSALYKPLATRPMPSASAVQTIMTSLEDDARRAGEILGVDLIDRWGWQLLQVSGGESE